jgi:hypothetical protein
VTEREYISEGTEVNNNNKVHIFNLIFDAYIFYPILIVAGHSIASEHIQFRVKKSNLGAT